MTTRVQKPKDDDWGRLVRMMRYLNGTRNDKLILSANDVVGRYTVREMNGSTLDPGATTNDK